MSWHPHDGEILGAQLQGASLRAANVQGAVLAFAQLQPS